MFFPLFCFTFTYGESLTYMDKQGQKGESAINSELKYQLIFEKSPVGIFQYNNDAIITDCNDRFIEILESKRELLIGLNMHNLHDKSILPSIMEAIHGNNGYYEGFYRATTSSAQIHIMMKTVPLKNKETGHVEGALGIVEDISDLYRTQQKLAEKEEHFRILSSLTNDSASILTLQPDGSFKREWLSSQLIDVLGYQPEEIDSIEKWATIVHPDDLEKFRSAFHRLLTKGERVTLEFRIKAKNGQIHWIENNVYPEYDQQGRPFRLISALREITQKKQQEQELEQQRNILKSIIDNAPIGIWLVNPDGSYPLINPWFSKKIGYGSSNFSMTEEEINQCRRSDSYAMQSDKPIEIKEKVTFVDGKKHLLHIFKQKLLLPNNELLGILGIATDITDQTQYEKALIEAIEKAEESDNLKSAFLANMSHEIRTPLNGIIGFSMFLRNYPNTPQNEREKFLQIISNSAEHLLSLINDIIDISKIDAGLLSINPEPININDLLAEIYTFFYNCNPNLEERGISFSYKAALPDSKAIINSDRMRLRQILTNLIGNALKFTLKGSVEFGYSMKTDARELLFYVRDTGIGIAKEKQNLIFQRFRQANEDISKQYGGNGLGLTICKSLIELMGGKIWVESEIDKGSCFYFTIPLDTTAMEKVLTQDGYNIDELKELLKEKTILIAEDDQNSLHFFKTLLKIFDLKILEASNGLMAVELERNHPEISAILMDIKMPIMSGYDAIRKIRVANSEIPIIVQTAHAFSNERAISKALGCNYFITKPIDPSALYQCLYNIMKSN